MRVNQTNNTSFKGLIKFNNVAINPKDVSIVLPNKFNNRFNKTFYIKMSDGKKFYYSTTIPNGKVADFSDLVSKYMNNNKTCNINADLKPLTDKNKSINTFI